MIRPKMTNMKMTNMKSSYFIETKMSANFIRNKTKKKKMTKYTKTFKIKHLIRMSNNTIFELQEIKKQQLIKRIQS